ncbi:MAG: alanine--glyoxylate aminotransferase family protein [Planctomycetaceae bacterium]|nr:alanine--glyoxylate aminotransferase family protein [Planctomycetaceae bacterium]
MKKYRLLTPGPTQVPEKALLAMAKQVTHHRTPEFEALYHAVTQGLKEIFQTSGDILLLAGSGTAAMEASVTNFLSPGEKALVLASGKFSERWRDICSVYKIEPILYEVPWGERFNPAEVSHYLMQYPDIKAVFGTLCETSTGVGHDIKGIARMIAETDALFIVDGISAVGAVECRMDRWGIDILAVGAQKALMGLPGLAILGISEKAWQKSEKTKRQAFYFDLSKYRDCGRQSTTPFTPPKSLMESLALNVDALLKEGIENVWIRTANLAAAFRAGLQRISVRLTTPYPSDAMTAAYIPEEVDAKRFMKILENRFGIKFAGGQGIFKGKIFRMAHFGIIDECDILGILAAIEMTLKMLGCKVTLGSAVAAAESVLMEGDVEQGNQAKNSLCP